MTTIKEIADMAGVSRGTIDRVLNHRGGVNPETEARIREIIEALHYTPNNAGRALAAQKKGIKIGVVLNGEGNSFFDDVLSGVQMQADSLAVFGCSLLIRNIKVDVVSQLATIDELIEEGVQGLVLSPCNDQVIIDKVHQLSLLGIPVITTNTDISGSDRMAYVGSNFYLGGRTAAGMLGLLLPSTASVAISTGSKHVLCHSDRIHGFCSCLKESYQGITVNGIFEHNDDEFESYSQTYQFLLKHPTTNALFFSAGGVYGGCKAIQALNRTDLVVICFDLPEHTKTMMQDGVITAAICQQPQMQGSQPVYLLYQYLAKGIVPERECYYVDLSIKIRESL